MARNLSRRAALKSAAAFGAFTILPSGLLRAYAANERVAVACVGVNNQGGANRKEIAGTGLADIVALCDVDERSLAAAAEDHPKAIQAVDFRDLLDKHGKSIDAVMVSTPDHLHAPVSMMAMRMGKHVDCEKPLTHSVYESRALAEAARKYKVQTQLDNEGHSSDRNRTAVEWIRAGAVGDVTEVHIWTNRPIWPQALPKRPPTQKVPSQLHWDLWLGPAPARDYHESLHPFNWRGWWDFGTGALGDIGCHSFDAPFWGLDLQAPVSVEAEHEGNTPETYPKWAIVTYQFPARKSFDGKQLPPVTLKWYDGGKKPALPAELPPGTDMRDGGVFLRGSKGLMSIVGLATEATPVLYPESLRKSFQPPPQTLSRPKSHKHDWLEAIRGGPAPGSNFPDFGSPLAETVLLGNVAIKAGTKIAWDAKAFTTGSKEADQYLKREYRKGWTL